MWQDDTLSAQSDGTEGRGWQTRRTASVAPGKGARELVHESQRS